MFNTGVYKKDKYPRLAGVRYLPPPMRLYLNYIELIDIIYGEFSDIQSTAHLSPNSHCVFPRLGCRISLSWTPIDHSIDIWVI